MWLLDVNMPRQLQGLLAELGFTAETAVSRGWGTFANGDLLEVAAASGFTCLLTRDRLFGESVAGILARHPAFSLVIISLPQARADNFLATFRAAWGKNPIKPIPGHVQTWP